MATILTTETEFHCAVGNLPFDMTETQITEILSEVGNVVSFRLVFDKDTGKAKGYGFCTFQDAETAASAVRNLNRYEIGGRPLRVDHAEADKEFGSDAVPAQLDGDNRDRARFNRQGPSHHGAPIPEVSSTAAPDAGRVLRGVSAADAVANAVSALQPPQIAEIIAHLK
eukprot:jgi/Hompol1/6541/HPOL_005016-RA